MDTFEQWALVELFGHSQIAGKVTEQVIGGGAFVRVDVPEVNGHQAFTKLYGHGAIYAMTIVDEETARASAQMLQARPIDVWSARRMLDAHDESRGGVAEAHETEGEDVFSEPDTETAF